MSLSLHYNTANNVLYAIGVKVYQFKSKDSEIKLYPLCLGTISKNFAIDNMKKLDYMKSCTIFLLIIILLILVILWTFTNTQRKKTILQKVWIH